MSDSVVYKGYSIQDISFCVQTRKQHQIGNFNGEQIRRDKILKLQCKCCQRRGIAKKEGEADNSWSITGPIFEEECTLVNLERKK